MYTQKASSGTRTKKTPFFRQQTPQPTERGDGAVEGRVHRGRRKAFHDAGGFSAKLPGGLLDDRRGAAVRRAVGAHHCSAPLAPALTARLLTADGAVADAGHAVGALRGRCTREKGVFFWGGGSKKRALV